MVIPKSLFPVAFDTSFRKKEEVGEDMSPPSGLCLTLEGNILVTDDFNHRIQIYDPQFNLINSLGGKGKEPEQFQYPKGIAIDNEGNIYVADSWNHRIQKFNSQGNHLQSFGSIGDGKGELNEPYDIHIDPSGNLVVVERYNHRIQFFNSNGESLGWVGQRGTALEEKLAENYETPLHMLAPPLFEFPTSIATDSCGNYFITDSGNHRIRKFNANWQELLTFGEMGNQVRQFQYPLCISIAPNDLLYIADLNNNRIQVFTSFGQFLTTIENAERGTPIEAPCLTLVDSSGNLFVGLTFDTQILKYQVPVETQNILAEKLGAIQPPNPEHIFYYSLVHEKCGNEPKSLAALEQTLILLTNNSAKDNSGHRLNLEVPLHLGRFAFKGKKITESALNLAIPLIENQLNESRKGMETTFLAWQEAAQKCNEIQTLEQQAIQNDPDGLREFNQDLYISEQEDKTSYRLTREAFYSFRKTTQQFYEFTYCLIESETSEIKFEKLGDLLARQLAISVNLIKKYFDQKERNEESMVQILGDNTQGNNQLSSFLIQYYYNCRTMDLLLHFQFELRTHWQNLRTLARKAAHSEKAREIVARIATNPSFSEDTIKILIRFHEHWLVLGPLELQFLETLDAILPYGKIEEDAPILEPTIQGFSPIAFDSENLNIELIARVIQSQAANIKLENNVLTWGQNKYRPDSLANQANELASQCLAILKGQSVFDEKSGELLNQLDDMGRQRRDLDAQMRQVRTEDKITPINIANNMAILDFQTNLVRRMVKGLDINENLALHRLILGTAIVYVLNSSKENSLVKQLFEELTSYFRKLENDLTKFCRERKSKYFELSGLNGQQKQLESEHEISSIDASIKIEESIFAVKADLDRLELGFQRSARTKNLLDLILNFTEENRLVPQTPLRQVFSLGKAGSEIGLTIAPQGLTHNSHGELLVADYEHSRIYCFSPEGKYQFHFGIWGNAPGSLHDPVNVATDSQNNIYVIDEKTRSIKKFDPKGNFILQFGADLLGPIFSLSIDSFDRIHIAAPEQNRIAVFDSNGKETLLPCSEEQSKNLTEPCGVFCLADGGMVVGDRSESLLKRFDTEGKLIRQISKEGLDFEDIYFIACDPQHGIFGSDFWRNQIVHLNNELELLDVYRKPGKRAGELGKVGGLSIYQNQLAVANFDFGKVQIFDLKS